MLPPLDFLPNRYAGIPPSLQKGCLMQTFFVRADYGTIQKFLDAMFDAPSGGAVRYQAIGDRLFASVAEIAEVSSLDPNEQDKGYLAETDVTVWILARVAGTLDIRWIPAWMFVDHPHAMVTGREVYGFPKQAAQFKFDPKGGPPRRFVTDTLTIPAFGNGVTMGWAPVIRLEPAGGAQALATQPDFVETFRARLKAELEGVDAEVLDAVFNSLASSGVRVAMLKQFSDAAQPRRACHQAIVEADFKVIAVRSLGFTACPYRAAFLSYASHPFNIVLGVPQPPQDVGFGVVVDMDFELTVGQIKWQA